MRKISNLNLSFIVLIITIVSVSMFGLKTIKDLDYILNDSVSIYQNPANCLNKIEYELLDIRYRMASVSAGVLSFAGVHYRLENSLKTIDKLFQNCQKWKMKKGLSKSYEEQLGLELMKMLPSSFAQQQKFMDNLNKAYADKDVEKVKDLYQNQWPYVHSSLMVPIRDARKGLHKVLTVSLKESLSLKYKFQMIWLFASIIVFTIASLMYVSVRSEFKRNEELNKEHMAMSKIVMIGEMASSIVHEINNPLSVIQMNGRILQKDIAKNGENYSKGVRSIPESLLSGVERISKIITGLKSFAYQGTGENSIEEFEEIPIAKVIEDSLLFTNHKMRKHDIEFIFNKTEQLCMTWGNVVQLSQVFVNMINNAIDAIESLDERWIKIDILNHDSEYEVRITDSGKGIPKAIQDTIFKTFYTTKKRGKGTGLGLSISAKILAGHNGRLLLDKEDAHTCFQVFLPRLEKFKTI